MPEPAISIEGTPEGVVVRLAGTVVTAALAPFERRLRDLPRDDRVVLDLSAVEALDTGGA